MNLFLPQNLYQLRKSRNLRQEDVAAALHMRRQTYGSYEKGVRTPSLETLIQLADYYQLPVDYLLRADAYEKLEDLGDPISVTEKAFLSRFRSLPAIGKKEALNYVSYLEYRFTP